MLPAFPLDEVGAGPAVSALAAVRTSPQRERIRRYSRDSMIGAEGVMGGPASRRQSLIQPASGTGMLTTAIAEMGGGVGMQRSRLERTPTTP